MSKDKVSIDRLNIPNRGISVSDKIRVIVCPTTGGQLELRIPVTETVQGLKWLIAKRLKIAPEKISLLHKDRTLKNGTLYENQITDTSHITLLPNMESGMTFQRPDASVVQALENLSESQINDFLTGRAPLLLAMRVGDHMMFVQLKLSTAQCAAGRRSRQTIKSVTSAQPSATPGHSSMFPSASSLSPASLVEANRNISQKLQELSQVSTNTDKNKNCEVKASSSTHSSANCDPSVSSSPLAPHGSQPASPQTATTTPPATATTPPADNGAVINSMNHLGQGVFSGTFSGTLDPTLQDQNGKPKKDINTIVHILNDLLGVNAYQLVHPYVTIRTPTRKPASRRPSSPVLMKDVIAEKTVGDIVLKEKVQHLQRMMQERKMKRKARRQMKVPYQWNTEQILPSQLSTYNTLNIETGTSSNTTCNSGSSESNSMDISESVDSSTYRNSKLEHESLAV